MTIGWRLSCPVCDTALRRYKGTAQVRLLLPLPDQATDDQGYPIERIRVPIRLGMATCPNCHKQWQFASNMVIAGAVLQGLSSFICQALEEESAEEDDDGD